MGRAGGPRRRLCGAAWRRKDGFTCASNATPLVISSSAVVASAEKRSSPGGGETRFRVNGFVFKWTICSERLFVSAVPGSGAMLSSNTSAPWNGSVTKSDLRTKKKGQRSPQTELGFSSPDAHLICRSVSLFTRS